MITNKKNDKIDTGVEQNRIMLRFDQDVKNEPKWQPPFKPAQNNDFLLSHEIKTHQSVDTYKP